MDAISARPRLEMMPAALPEERGAPGSFVVNTNPQSEGYYIRAWYLTQWAVPLHHAYSPLDTVTVKTRILWYPEYNQTGILKVRTFRDNQFRILMLRLLQQ